MTLSSNNSTTRISYVIPGGTSTSVGWGDQIVTVDLPETPSGIQGSLKLTKNEQGEISPKLYIKYLKSKLTKVQKERLKIRLAKLQKMVLNAHDMGQTTAYEKLSEMLAVVIRESEAHACGVNTYVDQHFIDKFMSKVKEKPVRFETLDKFPRTIPLHIRKKIKTVQTAKLFDTYKVLYLDYTKEETKSTKDKIREKDPILFGSYSYQPYRHYFIADWIDEYCDLTMDKFVDKIKQDDPEFALTEVPDMNDAMFDLIKKEVRERHERLKGTHSGNYKDNMKSEDEAKSERDKVLSPEKEPGPKRPGVWARLRTKIKGETKDGTV